LFPFPTRSINQNPSGASLCHGGDGECEKIENRQRPAGKRESGKREIHGRQQRSRKLGHMQPSGVCVLGVFAPAIIILSPRLGDPLPHPLFHRPFIFPHHPLSVADRVFGDRKRLMNAAVN